MTIPFWPVCLTPLSAIRTAYGAVPRASLDARIDTEGRKKLAEVVQTSLAEDGTPAVALRDEGGESESLF